MTHNEGKIFRPLVGLLCVVGSLVGFGGLYFIEIPVGNRDAMMLALGIIFGWGSAVVQSEYGSTATGRKVADSAIRNIERQNVATDANPQPVVVTNPPANPVNTAEATHEFGPRPGDSA